MTSQRWNFRGLRDLFGQKTQPANVCMKVVNLTRQTVLATSVEVADSGPKRNKGLLGRDGLASGEGLWIVPCEAVHTFAMKFPLDLVYLDRKYKVKKIRTEVVPWRFSACLSAHSVLELGSGSIQVSLTQRGDVLELIPASTGESASPSHSVS